MAFEDFELLLARADDHRPVLDTGLPLASTFTRLPAPPPLDASTHLWDSSGDPQSLPAQRWGVVAPRGPEGDRLLALIQPLLEARQEGQKAPVRVYRLPPGMDGAEALSWKRRELHDEARPEQEWPRYLLLLGDLDQLSLELQQALSGDGFVGRLAFRNEEHYAAYVDKVLRWERSPSTEKPRSLFFTAHDNTSATRSGYRQLVVPCLEACRSRQRQGDFPAGDILEVGEPTSWSVTQLLEQAAVSRPSVLLSVSHGLGAPSTWWRSADAQRALQGAMDLGQGMILRAEDVASRPFLPGGIWFYLACFGAGTPATSAYLPWLRRLQENRLFPGSAEAVLAALPREGDRPFIAALPQAALANPQGPLAVVGHVDLAWSISYQDVEKRDAHRSSRFLGMLNALVRGRRAGTGLGSLLRVASEVNAELTTLEDRDEARRETGRALPDVRALRGFLWMLRQDVSAYVLLGDPAVRLPVAAAEARESVPARTLDASALLGMPVVERTRPDAREMEEAVLELLRGKEAREIATRVGVSPSELRDWMRRYQEAGQRALRELHAGKP
jgi:hypothetical protein